MAKNFQYCENYFTNYYKHIPKCDFKKKFNRPLSEIYSLVRSSSESLNQFTKLKEENVRLNKKIESLVILNKQYLSILNNIKCSINSIPIAEIEAVSLESATNLINDLPSSEYTISQHLMEWDLYREWWENNQLHPLDKKTINMYFKNIYSKYKYSTLVKKRSKMQAILREINKNPLFSLPKIPKKYDKRLKYAMNDEEIQSYLDEQKRFGNTNYLIQRILIETGCRINSVVRLRVSDLEFLYQERCNIVNMPDRKTGNYKKKIEDELKNLLDSFTSNRCDDDYVFYWNLEEENKRYKVIRNKVNKRIRKSEIFNKNKNYAYTVHMFRTTLATRRYNLSIKKAKDEARVELGHKENSKAIDNYIQENI